MKRTYKSALASAFMLSAATFAAAPLHAETPSVEVTESLLKDSHAPLPAFTGQAQHVDNADGSFSEVRDYADFFQNIQNLADNNPGLHAGALRVLKSYIVANELSGDYNQDYFRANIRNEAAFVVSQICGWSSHPCDKKNMKEALSILKVALSDPSINVRHTAYNKLGFMGAEQPQYAAQVIEMLKPGLDDMEDDVKLAAAIGIMDVSEKSGSYDGIDEYTKAKIVHALEERKEEFEDMLKLPGLSGSGMKDAIEGTKDSLGNSIDSLRKDSMQKSKPAPKP